MIRFYPLLPTSSYPVRHDPPLLFPIYFVQAGFPSPAQDYLDLRVDLNQELIRNAEATFFGRVIGDSMVEEHIDEGDVLIVDKSLSPVAGEVVISSLNGEFTVKRYELRQGRPVLIAGNPQYPPIYIDEWDDFIIWGVVTYVIKKKQRRRDADSRPGKLNP